ncbi:hypothetical protein C8Q76DRAFT_800154 [Earliella scabrosa]|nr:hypothetical protein C8Q76DRAFT_800154 [Earliella scabrosa]
MLIKRAGTLPLRVHTDSKDLHTWTLASGSASQTSYQSRIHELCQVGGPPDTSHLERLLPALAAHLVYLNISPDDLPQTRNPEPRYTNLFGQLTPVALKALAISLSARVLPSDHFPSLAHLRISGGHDVCLGARSLLQLLANTPQLETLHLVQTFVYSDYTGGQDVHVVPLNRMRALCFNGSGFADTFTILGHLRLPPTSMIQLHRLDLIHRSDIDKFAIPPIGELAELDVCAHFPNFHIRVRGTLGGFWAHMRLANSGSNHVATIRALLARITPLVSTVHTLRLATSQFVSTYPLSLLNLVIPHATADMPALSCLVVACRNNVPRELASAIQSALVPRESDVSRPSRTVPCPSLQTLIVQSARAIPDYTPLVKMLAERVRLGHPIRKLCVSVGRDHDEPSVRVRSSGVADHVESTEVRNTMFWDPERESYWRAESPYWSLYPEKSYIDWLWGLPPIGW